MARTRAPARTLTDLLFDSSDAGLCLVAPDGTVLRVNSEWLRSTGFTREQVIGEDIVELFPATRDIALAMHGRARAGHRVEVPRHAQVVNGRDSWWEGSIEPVAMERGTGLLITAREVSARGGSMMSVEEVAQLKAERDRALDVLERGDAVYVLDSEFRYVLVNEAQEASSGKKRAATLGRVIWEVWPEAASPKLKFWEVYHRVMRERVPEQFEEHFAPLDLWVEVRVFPTGEGGIAAFFRRIDDRKRAEQALRESNALLAAISDTSTDVIFAKDREGRLRFANPATLALIGKSLDAVLGRTDAELLDDQDAAREVMANDRRIMDAGIAEEVEERVPMPDGTERIWLSMKSPRRDDSGRVVGLLGISRDITDRKRAEDALRASEGRLQVALNAARMTAWEYDPSTGQVTLSDNAADVVTVRAGRLHQNTDQGYALIHPEDVERHRALVSAAVERAGGYVSSYRHLGDDGEVLWLEERGKAITDASGKTVRLVGVTQNITERKRAEDALRASEERWNAAIENFSEGAIIATEDEQVVYWNPAARAMHGFTTDREGIEPLAKTTETFQLWTPDGNHLLELDEWPMRRIKRGETVRGLELRLRRPDQGWERFVSYSGAMLRTGSGERLMFLSVSDLTEQRRAELALREADRRKDEFLAMLAHELRNPLAPIRNSSYILRHSPPSSDQARRSQDVIERQTQHLTRLVDDLLDVTRIARGKIELRRERIDLREIASRAAEDFRFRMDENRVTLRVVLPEAKLWADADPTRITQLVGNLLHNASKFTRSGDEVVVTLHAEGPEAEISVRDTGAGIDAALLPGVFDAFVQGERTLARTEGGLGLGLALVKGIAELHGGTVRAESAGNGKGAEFVVRLPLLEAAGTQDAASTRVQRVNGGRRVLVVDDNTDAAESLADIVVLLGHAVDIAYDGPTAVDNALANAPDVVLCDIGLPGMSGYEVAKALRAAGMAAQLFAVSGYAQPEDVRKAIEAGFDGHIAKPPKIEDIERLLA